MRDVFYSIESEGYIVGKRTLFGTIEKGDDHYEVFDRVVGEQKDCKAENLYLRFDKEHHKEKELFDIHDLYHQGLTKRIGRSIDGGPEKIKRYDPIEKTPIQFDQIIMEISYSQMVVKEIDDELDHWSKQNSNLVDIYYLSFEYEDLKNLEKDQVVRDIVNKVGARDMIKFVISDEDDFKEHKPWLRKVEGLHPNIFVLLDTEDKDLITRVFNYVLEEGIDVRPQMLPHKMLDEVK
jgi:hypothetical protein